MAQQIKNNTLGFLNTDDEPRLLPQGDYVDSLNIRRQVSSQGVPTPVKNFLGNAEVNNSNLASGDNVVIGQTTIEELNTIYYFVWNSTSQHSIYQYNSITENITKVVEDSYLNFQKTSYITGVNAVTNLDGDVLLYWTDNFNPPRKINVKRAIFHNQGDFVVGYGSDFSNGTDAQKAVYYDAVKHPPLNPPTFSFSTDPSRKTNNIRDGVFQFRYRYIYDDGERSAYSPWSKLAISDEQKLNNTVITSTYTGKYNNIIVFFEPSDQNNVERIELTFRKGNSGDERTWFELENNPSVNAEFFYNDSVAPLANTSDTTKLYDAVPLLAKGQEVKNNVLFYSNTVDGFNLPDINSGTKVVPSYEQPFTNINKQTITVTNTSVVSDTFVQMLESKYRINFNQTTVEEGKIFVLSFFFTYAGRVNTINEIYRAEQGDTITDVLNYFEDEIKNFNFNYSTTVNTYRIGNDILDFELITYFQSGANYNVSGPTSNSYAVLSGLAFSTHKSGAYHPYGIVYYDRANRSSTVLKIGNPYVKFRTERSGNELLGAVDMNVRIDHKPPAWATHYQIVYAGNNTVDEFFQFTCSNVFKGEDVATTNGFDRIYLSLRNFKGTEYSWRESTGAFPDYNFNEGDRLRIINYYDPALSERVSPIGYLDFKVVGYEILSSNSADNPLITTADNTTLKRKLKSGQFLILEDPKVTNFDVDSGTSRSNGYWFNQSAQQGAFFEIYRPKAQTDDIPYYEVGEKYEVLNAGESNRKHAGGIRNQDTSLLYSLDSATDTTLTTSNSATDLVVGDVVQVFDNIGTDLGVAEIVRIDLNSSTSTIYLDTAIKSSGTAFSVALLSSAAVTKVIGGDSWYKPRALFKGNGNSSSLSFQTDIFAVEDYYANDYLSSAISWNRGRPHFYSPNARRARRKATVWYSEPFFPQDDSYNGFSAFNLGIVPYRDYDQSYGGIQVMKQNNQGIILWQEDKTSKILIDRNIIESAEGQGSLTTSQKKLGVQVFYAGDYGVAQQPESLNGSDGVWYWLDLKRGKYLRLSNDGITPVSDYKMRNYFYSKSKNYLSSYAQSRVIGGYDTKNEESIISFPTIITSTITTSSGDLLSELPNSEVDGTDLVTGVDIEVGQPDRKTFGNENRAWGGISETWGTWGGNLYSTNKIAESGAVLIDSDQNEEAQKTGSTAIDVYLEFNTRNGNPIVKSSLDVKNGNIITPTNDANSITLEATTTTAENGVTLGFYEPANRWSTFYSFKPEYYSSINSLFFSFKDGKIYEHEASANYNEFYGTTYHSTFSPVLNEGPFDVKSYYAVMVDGTTPLDIVATSNLNGTTMSGDNLVLKEGRYYGYFPFATSSSGDSAIIGLGEITVSGTDITITGGGVSSSGIFVGDTIKSSAGGSTTITAISGNVISLSSATGFSNGNFVYVERNNAIDGDRLRGNYLQLDCTITTADQVSEKEVYSVDIETSKSYY